MSGAEVMQEGLFRFRRLEEFVPKHHPLSDICTINNGALIRLDAKFDEMYAHTPCLGKVGLRVHESSVEPMNKSAATTIAKYQKMTGFSLIEIAIVMIIVALLATFSLGITSQLLTKQRRDTTIARLAQVESAFALFVAQNKFLPCPANGTLDGTLAVPSPQLGREQVTLVAGARSACALVNQQDGILPWVTLGISAVDAQDGWANMFTYRVEESLVRTNSMDFTMCTPAGTNPTAVGAGFNLTCQPCTTATFPAACNDPKVVTTGRGLRVTSVGGTIVADPTPAGAPVTPSTGAAYVVISHGENQAGSYHFYGTINAGTVASGTQELKNYASAAYPANSLTAYLVDDVPAYAETTAHFDDFVLRASIMGLAVKAQLGPRAY